MTFHTAAGSCHPNGIIRMAFMWGHRAPSMSASMSALTFSLRLYARLHDWPHVESAPRRHWRQGAGEGLSCQTGRSRSPWDVGPAM